MNNLRFTRNAIALLDLLIYGLLFSYVEDNP